MDLKEKLLANSCRYYKIGRWYPVSEVKSDHKEFIEALKHRIDIKNDFEFNDDYTMFKRILTIRQIIDGNLDPDGDIPVMVSAYQDHCLSEVLADPTIAAKLQAEEAERKSKYRKY